MLRILIDEFNCNHQADLDSDKQVSIFVRDKEKKVIQNFLQENMNYKKAGLMYLCGHPGTGKTSLLNLVLSEMRNKPTAQRLEVFLYNAMTYSDVKTFQVQFLEDASKRLTGQEISDRVNRSKIDDEQLSN